MTRVAAIDCGTNTINLLIAEPVAGGLRDVLRTSTVVRLGAGVDQAGRIDPVAMARTLEATATYAGQCDRYGVSAVRFVATSASRDADNADEFVTGVRQAFAPRFVSPEVISGDTEAELSFRGATTGLSTAGVPGPYLVVDVGGGSTELVLGHEVVQAGISLDIGSVRLTERHLVSDPPTTAQLATAETDIAAALDAAEEVIDLASVATIVGIAGSITTITAYALGLERYDPAAIHLATMTPAEATDAATTVLHMPRVRRAAFGFMHPGRVDVIGAGALIWREVIARVQAHAGHTPVVASEHNILDGIALSLTL
ncbi:MAG: exopolyphosphatase [Nostocoides sp.]